jgi:GTP-binding protein
MIDQILINIKSGNGGQGAISGRHEKFIPRGGPDGGDGGDGGSVYFISDENERTLLAFRYKKNFKAENGGNGAGAKKHGANGKDIFIKVPLGTQIYDESDFLLVDMVEQNQKVQVLPGGKGGNGNVKYSSSTNQYPVIAQSGEEGKEINVRLDLKLLGDVGLVGAPNAGKSSLISFLTAATPKIANYPFTTLEPVLGVVEHRDKDFVLVDIPGLIEGAHKGVGLGHEFLRHVERTKILIHIIDGTENNPRENFDKINKELEFFNTEILDKPQVVVVNKIDLEEVSILKEEIKELFAGTNVDLHFVSAVSGEGVSNVMDEVVTHLFSPETLKGGKFAPLNTVLRKPSIKRTNTVKGTVLKPKPKPRGPQIEISDGLYTIIFPSVERIAKRIDYEDWTARMQLYKHMKKTGVVKALEEAGIKKGDTVKMGGIEWEWD